MKLSIMDHLPLNRLFDNSTINSHTVVKRSLKVDKRTLNSKGYESRLLPFVAGISRNIT